MKIDYLTPEEFRAILNEELDKRLGPIGSSRSYSPANVLPKEDDLIDSKEACRILGCGERTLQRYRSSRLLNVIYRGPHRCFYLRSEILAFRAANTRPSRDSQ